MLDRIEIIGNLRNWSALFSFSLGHPHECRDPRFPSSFVKMINHFTCQLHNVVADQCVSQKEND